MKKKTISMILAMMMAITPVSVSAQEDVFTSESVPVVETETEQNAAESYGEKKYQGFSYIEEDGAIVITHYNGNAKDVKVPETIKGKKVLYIRGINAFNSTKIRSVSMPSILGIGNLAFSACRNLEKVYMPKVRSIGLSAFANCALTNVKLPSVETVSMSAFSNCTKLSSISMPKIRFIGRSAFADCKNLKTISLSYRISEIQSSAFMNCGATSIKLQDLYGSVIIGANAFGYRNGSKIGSVKKINGFKIYGNVGTSVEKYAKENGFKFISSKPSVKHFTLEVKPESFVYTGKDIKPKVTVTYNGKKISDKNYTVKYSNNRETGIATILVTGKGNYKDYSGFTTFEIIPKPIEKWECSSKSKGMIEVTWKYDAPATYYWIQFTTKEDFTEMEQAMVDDTDKKVCVKNDLESGKEYYVRICVSGIRNNSNWSEVKTVIVQ